MGETITAKNYLHHLFIDEVKNMLLGFGTSGGNGDGDGDCGCDDTDCDCIVPGGCVPDDQIATSDDITDVLDDVFGP